MKGQRNTRKSAQGPRVLRKGQRSSGHSGVLDIKGIGEQASGTRHHCVQDIGISSRLEAHPFIVWFLRPLRVTVAGPALGSANQMCKWPTFWAKGPVAYICSLLLTIIAMDTRKTKAQLCTVATGWAPSVGHSGVPSSLTVQHFQTLWG